MRTCNNCEEALTPALMWVPSRGAYCTLIDLRTGEVGTDVPEPVERGTIRVDLWCPNCDGEASTTITPFDLIQPQIDFYNFIKQYAEQNTILGDLADDVLRDTSFPSGKHSVGYFRKYLESQNACEGAMDAFEEAIAVYREAA